MLERITKKIIEAGREHSCVRRSSMRRVTAMALTVCMAVTLMPMNAFALQGEKLAGGGLCDHHPVHTEECGFAEAVEGHKCDHIHTEDCYTDERICDFEEDQDKIASDSNGEHTHTYKCYKLDCPHARGEHDTDCGYVEAVKGHACEYVCGSCNEKNADNSTQPKGEIGTDSSAQPDEETGADNILPEEETEVATDSDAQIEEEAVRQVEALIKALLTPEELSALAKSAPAEGSEEYDAWLAEFTAAKKAIGEANSAWNALSDEQKELVAPELAKKLEDVIAALQAVMMRSGGDAITIKVNGGNPVSGASLQAALYASRVSPLSDITSIEITAGEVTNDDWKYLLNTQKDAFTGLKTFVVDDAVASVAKLSRTFLPTIETVRIPHLQEINQGYTRVFYNCTALKSVSLPDTATIGQQAFMDCTELETITLPSAVTVDSQAFSGCSSLKTVVLPKVETLNYYAFYNTSSVTSLSLPATPPDIGGEARDNFTGLTGETPILHFVDGDGTPLSGEALKAAEQAYLAAQDSSTADMYWHGLLVRFAITVTFTDSSNVTHTDAQGGTLFRALYAALDNDDSKIKGITSLKITGGKVTAKDWNFLLGKRSYETNAAPPSGLKELVITEDVMSVDEVTTYLPSTLEKIDMAKITTLPPCGNSRALETVRLPDLLTASSFRNCPKLTTVFLPKVTNIGESAFNGCQKLTDLTLPAVPPASGAYAFDPPETGQKLTLVDENGMALTGKALQTALRAYKEANDGNTGDFEWYGWHLLIENINVTFGTADGDQGPVSAATLEQAIAIAGFQGEDITKVVVTAGELTTSDWHRLSGQEMPNLKTLEIKDTATSVQDLPYSWRKPFSNTLESVSVAKLENLPVEAFKGLTNLKTADFPDLKVMEYRAFIGCTALENVNCPVLTKVPSEAFSGCTSLESAAFDAATEIGFEALDKCTSLTELNAPKARSIGMYAFQNCAFTELSLPAAETIGGYAFRGNAALETLSLPRATEIGEHAFLECDNLQTLKLPATPPSGLSWAPDKANGHLTFVDENGTPLSDASAAQAAYMAADDGNTQDGMWRGWKVKDTMTATVKTTENAAGVTVKGGSLKNMLYSIHVGTITSLEITGGSVTADDWTFLQKAKSEFTSLENLTVTDTVDSVANIPAGRDKDEVIFDPSINPWDENDLGNNTARSLPRILTDDPPIIYTSTMPETLKTVSIAKVTFIGHDAFKNCTNLTSAVFPAVTEIDEHAFIGCTNLVTLSVPAAAPTVRAEAFSGCAADRTVYFVAADGTALTGTALNQARSGYTTAGKNDGAPNDGLWYGWKLQDSDTTTDPAFSSAEATFASAGATAVNFTLTNAVSGTYQAYAAATGGEALTDPAVSVQGGVLTLTFTSKPTGPTTYYISATEQNKAESARTPVIVKPHTAPTPDPTYAVTVKGGTGSNGYAVGETVRIIADQPETGKMFDKWITNDGVIFADANSADTSFTMPSKAVTVTATYKDIPADIYTVTFNANGGTVSPDSKTTGTDGKLLSLPIPIRSGGYRFDGWFTQTSGGTQITTDFIFTEDTTIYAHWTYTGGNSGSSGSSNSSRGGSSGSYTTSTTTTTPGTTTRTEDGGSVTSRTTTSTTGTTVNTQVKKDASGQVTEATAEVTAPASVTRGENGQANVGVAVDANAVTAAGREAGTTVNVTVKLPADTIKEQLLNPQNQSVQVEAKIPASAAVSVAAPVTGITLEKDALEAAKVSGKDLTVSIKDENGNVISQWTFAGEDLKNSQTPVTDVNLAIRILPVKTLTGDKEDIKAKVSGITGMPGEQTAGLNIDFGHSGLLPSTARIRIPAGNDAGIKPGDTVSLYYYNPVTKQLETMQNNQYVVDAEGFVTIQLTDCANYVLIPHKQGGVPFLPQRETAGLTAGTVRHTVKKGDTVHRLAIAYGCTVDEILALNHVPDIYDLNIGQELVIPVR